MSAPAAQLYIAETRRVEAAQGRSVACCGVLGLGLSLLHRVCGSARRAGSVIELERIEGKIFKTTKEAEAPGLELARAWVD
jgi:hypothetical protein